MHRRPRRAASNPSAIDTVDLPTPPLPITKISRLSSRLFNGRTILARTFGGADRQCERDHFTPPSGKCHSAAVGRGGTVRASVAPGDRTTGGGGPCLVIIIASFLLLRWRWGSPPRLRPPHGPCWSRRRRSPRRR